MGFHQQIVLLVFYLIGADNDAHGQIADETEGGSGATVRMTIDQDGNVGVGTTPTTHTFEALSTNTASFLLDRNSGSNASSLSEYNTFYALSIKNRTNGSYLRFGWVDHVQKYRQPMVLATPTAKDVIFNPYGGNVGIGTTNPTQSDGQIANTFLRVHNSGATTCNFRYYRIFCIKRC